MLGLDSSKLKRVILYYYHPATPDVLIRKSFIDLDSFYAYMSEKRHQNKCIHSYSFEYVCSALDLSDISEVPRSGSVETSSSFNPKLF